MNVLSASSLDPKSPRPGVYKGVPFEQYVQIQALNNSSVQDYHESGSFRAMRARMLAASADSPATRTGTLLHLMLLEPEKFAERVVVGGPRHVVNKGKPNEREVEYGEGTKAWADFEEQHPGKVVMPRAKADGFATMVESVVAHPEAKRLLVSSGKNAVREATIIWEQKFTTLEDEGETVERSVMCKGRADAVLLDEPVFVDLKTTRSALTPQAIGREFARFGYYRAAWMYAKGLEEATGQEWDNRFVIVQNEPPHECVVAFCPREVVQLGWSELYEMLPGYERCIRTGQWLGAGQRVEHGRTVRDIMPVELPRWKLADFADGD